MQGGSSHPAPRRNEKVPGEGQTDRHAVDDCQRETVYIIAFCYFFLDITAPMMTDLPQRSLMNRLYFSPVRCVPGHRFFMLSGAALALASVALRTGGAHHGKWGAGIIAAQIVLAFVFLLLVLLRYGLSYPGTNVIAHGNGYNHWTIHMGPAVSLLPWYYARQHSAFLRQDVYKVLHQIDRHGMTGTVRLESPLLADPVLRRLAAAKLRNIFPHWTVHQQLRDEPLSWVTAWQLTRLREALRRRKGSRPFQPFRGGAPVGLITLAVRPRPAAVGMDESRRFA